MVLTKVSIDELQPTDLDLVSETIFFYRTTFPLLRDNFPPEVWMLRGKMYIADGNNQVYDFYERGRKNILVKLFTPENCSMSSDAYEYALSQVLEKAGEAEDRGIRHISDLKIA